MTFSDGYPKVCIVCGRPVRITGTAPLRFEWNPVHGRRSWHFACIQPTMTASWKENTMILETPAPTEPEPEPQPDDNGDEDE